jgi:hypothetical protein
MAAVAVAALSPPPLPLPPQISAVVMKTQLVAAMAGAQTRINNK